MSGSGRPEAISPRGRVLRAFRDGVLTLILDRPEKKNALNRQMYRDVTAGLAQAGQDAGIRAVLLRGSESCFTAGNDLADFRGEHGAPVNLPEPFDLLRALAAFEKPLVAAVEGLAVGIGTTLLPHCDLVYAGEGARFKTPFVDLGVTPEGASSLLLPAQLGMPRAAALLLLGETLSARQIEAWGLLTAVVADGQALEAGAQAALRLAAKPPEALRLSKRLMRDPQAQRVRQTIDREQALFMQRLQSAECETILGRILKD